MKSVAGAALACAILVAISVAFIDQPVERFVATHRALYRFYEALASPSLLSLPLASVYLVFYAFGRISGRPETARSDLLLALSVAIAMATLAKDELKWIIGRPWPIGWIIHGYYRLHPFTDNAWYGCFPSGHTAYIAAPMFVLWHYFPRYRALWLGIILMVMIGLVGSGYHYVGDVIAGLFLGLAVAAGTLAAGPKLAPGRAIAWHAPRQPPN